MIMMTVISLRCVMLAQEAKHFVRFARRQHRGWLVEDEEALVEIQELQYLKFLLFARRHGGNRHIERARETACGRETR